MAIQTQFRRGNTYSHSLFTGASGEITVDLDKKVAVVHDGATVGGHPLSLYTYTTAAYNQANTAVTIAGLGRPKEASGLARAAPAKSDAADS